MITVEVPNKGTVEFPDGMNPRDIEHALFAQWPDLADTPRKQAKAALLAQRDELLHKEAYGVPMGELQQAVGEGLTEGLTEPFVKLPRVETPAEAGLVRQTVDTVFNKLIGGVESLETPLSGALLATGAIAPKLAATVAGALGAGGVAQGVQETAQAKTVPEAAGGLTDVALSGLVAGLATKTALKGAPATARTLESGGAALEAATKATHETAKVSEATVAPLEATEPPSVNEAVPPPAVERAPLSPIEKVEAQAELDAATGTEVGPGLVGAGAAAPSEFPVEPPPLSRAATEAASTLGQVRQATADFFANRQPRGEMTVARDAGDTAAALFASERANDVRGDLRRSFGKDAAQAEKSLSFTIEAKGDYDALDAMREKLIDSKDADAHWRKEAVDAIDWAKYHWEELEPLANRYNATTDAEVASENAAGIDTLRRPGYVMHAQDVDESLLRGGGEPAAFKKVRVYDTFADSIAAGIDPRSLNAVDLLQSRIHAGQRMMNSRAWVAGLKELKDAQGAPLAADLVTVKRADGSSYQEAPKGYSLESFGRTPVAVRQGFEGIFHALTDPSAWSRTAPGQLAMKAAGGSKSLVLAIDTFHLGRVAFWDSLIKGLGIKTFQVPFPSYRKGATLLDMSREEITRMVEAGEAPKKWLPELLENKRRLDLAVKSGFNVGRISDALHQEWIRALPVLGSFNRFLFEQFQRGAMAESWLLEFERLRQARPEMPEAEMARTVSKALNTRFGNLGRQGLFKGRTAQDTARALALAPQWNEGLIRSELGAVKEAGQLALDAAQGKRLYAGLLLRSVGGMAAAQFAANQLINYATRGHPTWENPEEGFGAKLSAWIPDLIGKGPGFFLNPLGLAAETTHLLLNAYERSGDWQKTLTSYLRSRSSVAMRPVLTFITNTDFLGRTLKPGTVWGEMAKEVAPVPIGASGATAAVKQLVTGKGSEEFPGQIQKQVMGSLGVKTEQAPSPGQRLSKLADEYNKAHGVERESWQGPPSEYQKVTQALRVGNEQAASQAMRELLATKKASDVAQHYRAWPRAPLTGRRTQEGGFVRSLNAEQRDQYQKAQADRVAISQKALALLRSELAKKQASKL